MGIPVPGAAGGGNGISRRGREAGARCGVREGVCAARRMKYLSCAMRWPYASSLACYEIRPVSVMILPDQLIFPSILPYAYPNPPTQVPRVPTSGTQITNVPGFLSSYPFPLSPCLGFPLPHVDQCMRVLASVCSSTPPMLRAWLTVSGWGSRSGGLRCAVLERVVATVEGRGRE